MTSMVDAHVESNELVGGLGHLQLSNRLVETVSDDGVWELRITWSAEPKRSRDSSRSGD